MFRRQFIAHLGQFLGAGFVLPNPVNTRQKLHASEVISVVSTPLEQLIQPESVIVNKATGQAAWYYRGHLYLLKPTGRIHPNSPLECDISTVDKIPGTYRHSTRGWIMSDDWRNLVDVQKQIPDFDINNFVIRSKS